MGEIIMERINGYEDAKAYTDAEKLPAGGYVVKILDVNELVYDFLWNMMAKNWFWIATKYPRPRSCFS